VKEMPILSRTRGYLFLMAPRTGCTAVAHGVLIPHLDGEYFPSSDVLDDSGKIVVRHKHAPLGELITHGLLSREEAAGLFKFTTVRNPFDSLVTLYVTMRTRYRAQLRKPGSFVHRRRGMAQRIHMAVEHPFEQWVERRFGLSGPKGQVRGLLGTHPGPRHMYNKYIEGADFVMRFEQLQEDFNEVLKRIGVSQAVEIPTMNVTEGRDRNYRAYYTPKARAIVEKAFALDLQRFGYSF
jgi:hypothetical protein